MSFRIEQLSLFIFVAAIAGTALAEDASFEARAADKPNDGGGAIIVTWDKAKGNVGRYKVTRLQPDGSEVEVGATPADETKYVDEGGKGEKIEDGVSYRYVITAVMSDGSELKSKPSPPAAAAASWFNRGRLANLTAVVLFVGLFLLLVRRARKGGSIYIRPIAGLQALDDAVGRAAEMGKPVLYVPGLQDASDPATLASLSIFSKVAERAARLRTRVKVPNYSPLTWPVAQNVMREAYIKAERPEDFRPGDVTYLTSRSFTYAASVIGMMAREKPASNFLIGHFFSESLILAETGATTGAVQIGGTDSELQLPFFITTCDYTLIGEELFAAAAKVSEDPVSRSTVAAHDWFKAAAVLLIVFGLALGILGAFGVERAEDLARDISAMLKEAKR